MFMKMNQYPNLIGLMRSIFMDVLEQKGIDLDKLQLPSIAAFAFQARYS